MNTRRSSKKSQSFQSEQRGADQNSAASASFISQSPQFLEFPDTKDIDPYDPTTFGYIEIAQVIGAHGVHGWIKVRSTTDFGLERLCTPGKIRHLKPAKKRAPRPVVLIEGRPTKEDEYLIQLQDIQDRDAAQRLRGSILYARQEEKVLPGSDSNAGEEEEYLVSDLVGLEVFLVESDQIDDDDDDAAKESFVGKVGGIVFAEDLSSAGASVLAHDMLEIILPHNRQSGLASFRDELVLIPFVPQIVPRVDVAGGAVYIDPPGGLLDLTYVREEKVRTKGFLPSTSSAPADTRS